MYREEDDTEDLYNILETYLMQVITSPSLVLSSHTPLLSSSPFFSSPLLSFLLLSSPLSPLLSSPPLSYPLLSSLSTSSFHLTSLLFHLLPFLFQYFISTPNDHPPPFVSSHLSYPLFSSLLLLGFFLHSSHSHTQAENILSEIQKLRELIDQSESVILINLDSQRNIMLRLGLQLEMGMFSAAISGLIGMAFGMNLQSSLEEVRTVNIFRTM